MESILLSIKEKLLQYGVGNGARVVAAVSGGPDSMAMLHALEVLSAEIGYALEAAHYNHMLRQSSKRDEHIVRDYCAANGIVLHVSSGDIRALARGGNIEQTAREARYAFMLGLLGEGDFLSVAHHMHDQAESVLMNILRGAGTRGLAGIRGQRDSIIRPMLDTPKQDIDKYVTENHLPYGVDETNMSVEYTRNRVRLELLPYLQKNYNPNIYAALQKLSANAAEDESFLAAEAGRVASGLDIWGVGEFFRSFNGVAAADTHPAVGKRVLRMLLESMGIYDIDQAALNNAYACAGTNSRADLGGGVFIKGGSRAELYRLLQCDDYIELHGEGVYTSANWRLIIEAVPLPVDFTHAGNWTQYINIRYIDKTPLIARARRRGERMRPLGSGSKKLGDIMTDRKIPVALRDALPVIECDGEILWAVGVALSDAAATKDEDTAIKIRFEWNND